MAHNNIGRRELLGQAMRAGGASLMARALPWGVGAAVLGWPRKAHASTVLDPNDLSNFTLWGNHVPTPGAVAVRFEYGSPTDVSGGVTSLGGG